MALVVESTSSVTGDNQDSLTITKPTGVASGDLLLAITQAGEGVTAAISGFTVSEVAQYDFGPEVIIVSILYRIADSSDVSASDYTVTAVGSTSLGNAVMMRISGWTTGDPILYSSIVEDQADAASYSIGKTETLSRPSPSLMIMVVGQGSDDNAASFAGYSVTSGEANPSWTEVADLSCFTGSNAYLHDMAVAYANTSNLSDITAWTSTATSAVTGAADGFIGILAIIPQPQNVTPDVSHLAVTPTLFGPTVSQVNINSDVSHNAVVPVLNGLTAKAQRQAVWSNADKPTTDWNNPPK